MASNKKGSNKKKAKQVAKNLNASTLQSLKRLCVALKELDETGKSTCSLNQSIQTSSGVHHAAKIKSDIPLNHWREIPTEVQQAYKMFHDGAEHIKATSTKYTLLSKINREDGSKLSEELRQGAELISTSAFLLHQANLGCARPTRRFIKLRAKAIVSAIIVLIESMQNLRALDGNVGAQLTGALWQACDEAMKVPQGNRVCMRREMFTWVGQCNETMQEFQDLVKDSSAETEDMENASSQNSNDRESDWDDFCLSLGTGETYSSIELPVVSAALALIKCSRGILGITMKAYECAGEVVAKIEASDKIEADIAEKSAILNWIGILHEMSRKIADGMTDLGCMMYPPLNLKLIEVKGPNGLVKMSTEFEIQLSQQTKNLLFAAHFINDALPESDGEKVGRISMTEEVNGMCSKLVVAIEKRADEAALGIVKYREKSNSGT